MGSSNALHPSFLIGVYAMRLMVWSLVTQMCTERLGPRPQMLDSLGRCICLPDLAPRMDASWFKLASRFHLYLLYPFLSLYADFQFSP
jgi:hypothetical protein